MTSTITKIKNGTITLPPEVSQAWSGKDVVIFSDEDRVIVRRAEERELDPKAMMDAFQAAAKKTGLKESDALSVVREVREQMYGKS